MKAMSVYLGLDRRMTNDKDRMYTIEFKNADYRWWNPRHWFARTETYEHDTMTPITIRYERDRILITTDSVGHHLVEQCKEFAR